jgi:hypothetical protein
MKPCVKHCFHVIYIMDDIFCNMKYLFYKFMYCLSTVVIVLCDGQFSIQVFTSNVTITDVLTDDHTSADISQRVEK